MEGVPKIGVLKSHVGAAVDKEVTEKLLIIFVQTIEDVYAHLLRCRPTLDSGYLTNNLARDVDYCTNRVLREGLPFLTVACPRLGDWLDKLVWQGRERLERVEGFAPFDGLYPCFLKPVWAIMEEFSTRECDLEHALLYRSLRTLLQGFKKLEAPFTQAQIDSKMATWHSIEDAMPITFIPNASVERVAYYARDVLRFALRDYFPTCEAPKHGPGAVSGGERHNEKWTWSTLYESVHREWPYYDHLWSVRSATNAVKRGPLTVNNFRPLQLLAEAAKYKALKREPTPTSRMLMVPKDSRGPRIISCEPKELMYLQQGVGMHMMDYIQSSYPLRGHVNFEDQTVNMDLARVSSLTQEWSTIDLSDASDRVSNALVEFLFPEGVYKKLNALRSTATALPDGRIVPTFKFAPMGSALCFPVESLVFWSIAVGSVIAAICESPDDYQNCCQIAYDSVYVYGDDIIVSSAYAGNVMEALTRCGMKVNTEKSFCGDHPFRESCGIEAYKGFDVTPLRIKKIPPSRPSDGRGIIAYVKYAENSQYVLPLRSNACLKICERLLGPIPRVPCEQSFISIVTKHDVWLQEDYASLEWDPDTCYSKARVFAVKTKKVTSAIDGWSRLQRNLVQRVLEGQPDLVVDRASTQISKRRCDVTYLGAPYQ